MPNLKLAAFDADDLAVLSAHLQDAVLRVGDIHWLKRTGKLALVASRYDWSDSGAAKSAGTRRLSGLQLSRVQSVSARNLRMDAPDAVLCLLAITFTSAGEPPAGVVELTFSGGGVLRAGVECLEAALADLGPAWTARARPQHDAVATEKD